jgi:hypothetical protein
VITPRLLLVDNRVKPETAMTPPTVYVIRVDFAVIGDS